MQKFGRSSPGNIVAQVEGSSDSLCSSNSLGSGNSLGSRILIAPLWTGDGTIYGKDGVMQTSLSDLEAMAKLFI